MSPRLTLLEAVYLAIGTAIVTNEIFRTGTLTLTELMASAFFFGLLTASIADRTGRKGPAEFVASLISALRGGDKP